MSSPHSGHGIRGVTVTRGENAHNAGVIKAGSRQLGNTDDVNERHYQARVTREVHNSEFLPDFLDDDFNEFE
ncbi:MAG: hypothetical protein QM571_05035 [Micrococcaceae bacterium]